MHNLARWIPPSGDVLLDDADKVFRAYADAGMRVGFSVAMKEQNRIVYGPDDAFVASLPGSLADALRGRLATALSADGYLELFETLTRRHAHGGSGRSRILLSPKNVQWVSDALLARVKSLAATHRTGLHMHVDETRYQHRYAVETHRRTPLGHLHALGFLGPEVSCAHGVWLTDEDLEAAAASGLTVCHNPSSNLRLRSGVAPLRRMLERGVRVAIGMDSASLNDDDDMLQEIRLVSALHRAPGHDGWGPGPGELLHMATRAGAAACGFSDVGTLEVGQRADVVLLDLDRVLAPYGSDGPSLPDALLHHARPEHVEVVMVDGTTVFAGGRTTGVDQTAVLAELGQQLARPLSRPERERRQLVEALRPYIRRFYETW
jgi:cytosine/adenosine deaminase-related metal-dependent hydrolase